MDWETLWCFYNSGAFKLVAGVALFGVVGVIVPALFKLPSKRQAALGAPHTPVLDFNDARRSTKLLSWATLVASLGPFVVYFFVFDTMGGKTCEVTVNIMGTAKVLLVLLYGTTVIVLGLFGWFYLVWQRTLKMDNRLSGNG